MAASERKVVNLACRVTLHSLLRRLQLEGEGTKKMKKYQSIAICTVDDIFFSRRTVNCACGPVGPTQ